MPHPALSARRKTLALIATGTLCATALLAAPPAWAVTKGSGLAASETRALSGFQAIELRGAIDLVVRQGSREGVSVRADDNLLALVQTTLEGSGDAKTLRIQFRPGESVRTRTAVVVTVDVIKLNALASAGTGTIAVEALKTPALTLSIAGSGDVTAAGRAARFEVSIAGSGDVRARELSSDETSVSIAGSGDASVTAQKSLSVSIAGSGDVDYAGGAAVVKRSIAGSGALRQSAP